MPLPAADLTAFHKIAKRPFDDISSVAVGFALDVADGVVQKARIGLGGVAATPIRALATEAALEGKPWSAETVEAAAEVLARRGHADLGPAGQRGLPGGDARAVAAQALPRVGRGGHGMSTLSQRPDNPVVGETMPHESAALHVTGHALYTDDLVLPDQRLPARAPGAGAARARPRHPARPDAGVRRARRGQGADRRRRAGHQRRRDQARRAAVPVGGHVLRALGLLGARRDAARPRGVVPRRSRSTTSRCRRS